MSDGPRFVDEHHLQVGSYDFHCTHPIGYVPDGRIPVGKRRELVEDYIALFAELRPKRIRRMEDVAAGRVERTGPMVPMSRLAVELLLARASTGDAVAELTAGPFWVGVRRGSAVLEPGAFRVDEMLRDHFHQITPAS